MISRLPFDSQTLKAYCGKTDSRHVGAVLGEKAGLRDPLTIHNYYVPAGGDEPDPAVNPKFAHKLAFLDELRACPHMLPAPGQRSIVVGDLNVAPLECDVWSHKQMVRVVSHTPIECEKLTAAQRAGNWIDVARTFVREPEKLFTWWSYRAMDNWQTADRGRRLDHIWVSQGARRPARCDRRRQGRARLGAAVRPRAGHGDAGRLTTTAGGVLVSSSARTSPMSTSACCARTMIWSRSTCAACG